MYSIDRLLGLLRAFVENVKYISHTPLGAIVKLTAAN